MVRFPAIPEGDNMSDSDMIRALLVERAGLLRRGLSGRVKQVDEQLAARGYEVPREASAPKKQTRRRTA